MSLPHAILGILSVMPMSGYDLKTQAFDQSVAHFWQADQSQIYRTLSRMEAEGWVEYQLEVQTDRPNRKIYSLTDAGRAELQRWLHTEQPLPVNREAFLVQMFFGASLSNETLLAHIAAQRARHQARLAQFEQIPVSPLDDPEIDRMRTLWRLTLELGVALEQTYLNWLDTCASMVSELDEEESDSSIA